MQRTTDKAESTTPLSGQNKTAVSQRETAVMIFSTLMCVLATAARGAAGTRLHTRKNETLMLLEIDARRHQHRVGPFLEKNLQPLHFKGRIAHLGRFGYVHSQRRASAAWNNEDSHSVSG